MNIFSRPLFLLKMAMRIFLLVGYSAALSAANFFYVVNFIENNGSTVDSSTTNGSSGFVGLTERERLKRK